MKIKSKKETLLESIQLVQITSPKTTLPILSNILLEAYENKLTLIATDLELSIKTQLELEILTEGSICLPLKKLTEIIRELEDKEDVLIEVEENNRVIISSKE
ncbi:MAG: DNA polymerase III subunit beta, partial [Nitrospirota bacterium]